MRVLWKDVVAGRNGAVPDAGAPRDLLYRVRTSRPYQKSFRFLKRTLMPSVFALLFAAIGVVGLSRVMFGGWSAVGGVCSGSNELREVGRGAALSPDAPFEAKDPCWRTGLRVHEGIQYDLAFAGTGENAALQLASENGSGSARWFGVPFRRHLSQPWFKPIARIGAVGDDEYPLAPVDPDAAGSRGFTSRITARTTGELFLFVNDVTPFGWTGAYGDNTGAATVQVTNVGRRP